MPRIEPNLLFAPCLVAFILLCKICLLRRLWFLQKRRGEIQHLPISKSFECVLAFVLGLICIFYFKRVFNGFISFLRSHKLKFYP